MTLSPNATYGYSLPPAASMPLDMNSIVASLVEVTNALSVVMQQLGAGMSGPAYGQALGGQSALGGGPDLGATHSCPMSGCAMGASSGAAYLASSNGAYGGGGVPEAGYPSAADEPPLPGYAGSRDTPPPVSASPIPKPPPVGSDASDASGGGAVVPPPAPAPVDAPPPPAAPPSRGQEAVDKAKEQLGKPYVYGGNGPDGFDCSGLMQSTLKRMGIEIPRTSQAQFTSGTPIEKGDLQPGDLVFFNGDQPGHVGMYIGNGEYIHAPQTGDVVKISKLDDHGSYSGARRYT